MDLVHVQIIIETLRIKKDTKKAKETASMIKVKFLDFIKNKSTFSRSFNFVLNFCSLKF